MSAADVEFRCFVGGLAWATTDQSLEQAFSQYGEVIELKIINNRETGRSRGFRFVTFRDEHPMREAIEGMNRQELHSHSITVYDVQFCGSGGGGSGGFHGPCCDGGGGGGHRHHEGCYGGGGSYGRREGDYGSGRNGCYGGYHG